MIHVTARLRLTALYRFLVGFTMALSAWTRGVVAEPFSVGVALPLTGDVAVYGTAVQNGFALSKEDFPASTVQFKFEDNRYDAKESLSVYRSLVERHKVDLFFTWGESPLQSIAPLIERDQTPTIAMSLDATPAHNKKWIVLSVNHPRDLINTLRPELRQRGIRSIGFVVTEDPFFKALYEEFVKTAAPGESAEIIGTVRPGEVDLRSLVLKASRGKYDAIGVYLMPGQVRSFYREATRIGFSSVSFGTDIFESRQEITAAGKAMQGAIDPNFSVPKDFHRRYIERFKHDDEITFAYNAFVVGRWIHSTFGVAKGATPKSYDREAILQALLYGSFDGQAKVTQTEYRSTHISFPLVGRQVGEGGFKDL